MKLGTVNYDVKNHLTLFPLGDCHIGSAEFLEKIFKAHIDMIKKIDDSAVILTGDIINAGLHVGPGAGSFDDSYNPHEQFDKAIEWLYPIKDKIISVLTGNHETRIRNQTSFDVSKLMAKELGAPYHRYGSFNKIKVNDINFHVYAVHGSSMASTLSGKMNACFKLKDSVDADLYLMAHSHALNWAPTPYFKINNRGRCIEESTRHFILTGSFVGWDDSYGEMKNYALMPIGIPKIKLFGELSRGQKKIEVRFTDK